MSRSSSSRSKGPTHYTDDAAIGRQAKEFYRICLKWSDGNHTEDSMRSLTLYPPSSTRNGLWLAVAKAGIGSGRTVTFYRAADPLSCLVGIMAKIEQGRAEWKLDKWEG